MGNVISDVLSKVIDIGAKYIPDPAAKMEHELELRRMDQSDRQVLLKSDTDLALGQIEVNRIEAASSSFFVSGWRPAVGWICDIGLFYSFFLRPILSPFCAQYLGVTLEPLDAAQLTALVTGMLGFGGFRTFEKKIGVAK